MIEDLFRLSQNFIRINKKEYVRYFLKKNPLKNRFSIIVGQRGVGKTTAMIQHVISAYRNDIFTNKALYIQADHFLVGSHSLYEIAEQFYNLGGEMICFDEIHKYPNWSAELKSIYDTFPKLTIVASGSSALEIYRGSRDLSRRAVVLRMFGMSFREFIEFELGIDLKSSGLDDITRNHQRIADSIITSVEKKGKKVLALFKSYLEHGYYPYFREYKNRELFYLTLEQNVHTTLESDLIAIYPSLSGNSVKKIVNSCTKDLEINVPTGLSESVWKDYTANISAEGGKMIGFFLQHSRSTHPIAYGGHHILAYAKGNRCIIGFEYFWIAF